MRAAGQRSPPAGSPAASRNSSGSSPAPNNQTRPPSIERHDPHVAGAARQHGGPTRHGLGSKRNGTVPRGATQHKGERLWAWSTTPTFGAASPTSVPPTPTERRLSSYFDATTRMAG